MNDHDLLEAIGGIDEKFIKKADGRVKRPLRSYTGWVTAAVAALAIAVTGSFAVPALLNKSATNDGQSSFSARNTDLNDTSTEDDVHIMIEQGDTSVITYNTVNDDGTVTIPKIDLSGLSYDDKIIPMVVYNGRIYTLSERYSGDKARDADSLMGSFLGHAAYDKAAWENIDPNETKPVVNFGECDVYTVKGYDETFRICARLSGTDNNAYADHLFLDCLNGISLNGGKSLFEDKLHISERKADLIYQTHEDWNNAIEQYYIPELDEAAWNGFISAADSSGFEELSSINSQYGESLYKRNQAHLVVKMVDNTEIRLRLIEGGYLSYEGLPRYFVRIPSEVFDKVYEACGGIH